ncbi:UCH-domain-containing protein [Bimuria novae-zelandiae CBS 107.79]|uniref:ubiquitinyl hydrolase 1 n=1 Tax=Bimuria novae-zelandiae CBS 107.79 TaxID=1447943 RepID=A0A6A5VBF7_9PLEO|nr:UCH-domain-containing protein [Bimuria novae-zelandiae CBS 107.79]
MDPESAAFQPRDDFWRIQDDMLRIHQSQAELSDRVSRLERRDENDSRLKNVWGGTSPFPSVLGGTPQQVPLQQPTPDRFSNFDDHSSALINDLQLDADEEPRRLGTTSRANSVRFDETANHGHWSRPSTDFIPRTGSGMGGHPLSERSYSHRSLGGQSSAGQSVHSATSGRANSLTSYGMNASDAPGLAPGLFILGSVPAIIRCWLTTTFKHDTMLYAAVCSGSYASFLDLRLVKKLGYQDQVIVADDNQRTLKLSMYLPEAVPVSASSLTSSPAPQLPSLTVDFTVIENHNDEVDSKAIQIFLGSDMLRAHNADVLLSSNQLTIYDDDRSKLRIPLVRPEDEHTFKSLYTTSGPRGYAPAQSKVEKPAQLATEALSLKESRESPPVGPQNTAAGKFISSTTTNGSEDGSAGRRSLEQRPRLGLTISSRTESKDAQGSSPAARSGSSPAIWGNWRRDTEKSGATDWANVGKTPPPTYQRRDTGIKVLRKPGARTASASISHASSPSINGHSRFFDDGKRREEASGEVGVVPPLKLTGSGEKPKENIPALAKTRSANPVGGASAFQWLNAGGAKSWVAVPTLVNEGAKLPTLNLTASTPCLKSSHPPPAVPPPITVPAQTIQTCWNLRDRRLPFAGPRKRCPSACPRASPAPAGSPAFTTASKKRKTATGALHSNSPHEAEKGATSPWPHEGARLDSPRSSPLPASTTSRNSTSPPRFLPPHLKNEVLDATQDFSPALVRDTTPAVSSPSEAYANMTLDSDADADTDRNRSAEQRSQLRASSPAKRLHSDMDGSSMDVDGAAPARRSSGQSSPLASKQPPAPSTRTLRSTSVEMADVTSNGASAASSDSTSASNGDSTATSVSTTPAADLPSLDDQVNKVLALARKPLQDLQVGYVVSHKWLQRVWARTAQYAEKQHEFSKFALEGDIGPVDNSDLIDTAALSDDLADQKGEDYIPLRPGLMYEHDYEILPAEAWELVITWYGVKEGTPVIRRYAHNTSSNEFSENLQYEIYPPIFTLRKVRKTSPASHEPAKKLVASRSDSFAEFIKAAKQAVGISKDNVRIWRILNSASTSSDQPSSQQPTGILTPEASPPPAATLPLVMDAASLTSLDIGTQREEVTGKDELSNEAFNDDLNLAGAGLAEDQILVLEEDDDNGQFITGIQSKPSFKSGLGSKSGKPKSTTNSGRSTPIPSGPMTRGRTRSGKTRGTTGLTNLGNTCYMNSALQCIRSVEELAIYFLANQHKHDINTDNPLGHGGQVAKAYGGLLQSIYTEDAVSSFAPKNFKSVLGRVAPIFSGYGQQDSQEFLSFLVDGLHEDLNRIKKKPYTENPESDDNTVHDPEAIKALGNRFRAIHRSRNDSIAMDLFNGFYKNTMVCPDCNKVSITFDPYSLVTLQLPIEQTWQHNVKFVPLSGQLWELEVDIDKNKTIKGLKEYVGKRFGIEWNRLMVSEVYTHKFYRHLDDADIIAESNLQQRDEIFVYELEGVPSNWPIPKKKNKYERNFWNDSDVDIPNLDHPHHDKVMIPISHRRPTSTSYRAQGWALDLWPSFILVDRNEAKDYDAILKKVLGKVAQMTTRDILTEGNTSFPQSGSDVVLTTEEDASPNGDPRVQDGSMEGEDMVEVTMTEPTETSTKTSQADSDLLEVLRPGSFLPPSFRSLFEMKYARAGKEYVPTGWSGVDANKNYEPISKRVRVPSTRASSVQSMEPGSEATSSDADDDENVQFSADAQSSIEFANQSSDEDTMQPSIEEPPAFTRGGRQKNKKSRKPSKQERKHMQNRNFNKGKKGKNPYHLEQPSQAYEEPEDEDDERLIKMGEVIILDWDADAWDALFGANSYEDSRGRSALMDVEIWEDEELKEKKAKRLARKKNGLTLEECFAETSKSEVLSEDNAWYCSRCKELRRATKTLEIWTAPDILVVHLKRFSSHRVFRDKVDALVDFPIEGLDLSERVGLSEGKDLVYDLFAVDNHYGGLGGGHYTAYAKNFFDQQWYEYNDSIVSKKSNPEQVVSPAAYLLFYRRRSAGPLGPPELQDIVNNWRNPDSEAAGVSEGESDSRNVSPSGNGLRLGGSSHNGSSSAFGAGTGAVVGALRGGGSALGAGSLLRNGVAAGNLDKDSPPTYEEDEGYGDDEDADTATQPYFDMPYSNQPAWNFDNIRAREEDDSDNAALDEGDAENRMSEDFGDDIFPGHSTPIMEMDTVLPEPVQDDEPAEIHIKND